GRRTIGAPRHPDGTVRSEPGRGSGTRGPAVGRAHGAQSSRGLVGASHGQSRVPKPRVPNSWHQVPRLHRLGQPPDRHRGGELPRPARLARRRPQRVSRHRHALRPGVDRNDRGAEAGLHRCTVGHGGAAALRRPPGVARSGGGAEGTVSLPSGPVVRATRPPRRGGGPRAAASARDRAVKYVVLVGAALATLAAALLVGPANLPLADLFGSPIVWQLRLPRAVLAFLVGGALGVAAAVTTALVSLAEATELRNAFLWLWGGFSGASWTTVLVILACAPLPLGVLVAAARPLDLLALGEEPAQYLGADVRRLKQGVYLAASLLTAAAVAVAGVIGFVGLVVPHVCRLVWGRLHRTLDRKSV